LTQFVESHGAVSLLTDGVTIPSPRHLVEFTTGRSR
jgi:hypothetical protein